MGARKNISLIVGISIPIMMIIFVAVSIYLPGIFTQPRYNFLYASGNNSYYYGQQQYVVSGGKLEKQDLTPLNKTTPPEDMKIYLYDVSKNGSSEISLADAQKLNLNSDSTSPDGFEIAYGNRDEGVFPFFFFSSSDYNTRYLKGHNVSKKLNLGTGVGYNNLQFLGWVQQ